MLRCKASDSRYREINRLNMMLCILLNPTVHYNANKAQSEEDEMMWKATIGQARNGLQELIDQENAFYRYLAGME